MRILLVEDDAALCDALAFHLRHEGYAVDVCGDGEEALLHLTRKGHDLVILDRMLPGMDGIAALKAARAGGCAVPVLMLTALGGVSDRITGLDAGADDYLVKPFDTDELLARVRAMARRPAKWAADGDPLCYADLRANPVSLIAEGPGGKAELTRREMQLLEALLRANGGTLPRDALFLRVWGADADVEDANLDVYIHFLRKRLRALGTSARIATVHGVGYRMESP